MDESRSVAWDEAGGCVEYVDQRLLPQRHLRRRAHAVEDIVEALRTLAIRGAPAIGIAGAYGVLLAERGVEYGFDAAVASLRSARPTAVQLAWAVDRVVGSSDRRAEALAIHAEQIASDRAIARAALQFFRRGARVVTHCHTGALATAGEGTALGAIIHAHRAGLVSRVYVNETRPLLQGARLTLWELLQAGVPSTLLVDGAAASFMARGEIDLAIVGADRIARNRDTANKIGTYALAVTMRYHGLPFYVAAPLNTFDPALASGAEIPIEERAAEEVRCFGGIEVAGEGVAANPAFDVTPSALIAAIITEDGLR
jgi:methylthioribose-1-phosphate isomerase